VKRAAGIVTLTAALALAAHARGQARAPATAPVALSSPDSLLGHFGTEAAARLMRSGEADDRLRGIARAASVRTTEALALLERAARARSGEALDPRMPPDGVARADPRALLTVVRALADWNNDRARAALLAIVSAPTDQFATRVASTASLDPAADDAEGADRITLARQEAAIAVADSGGELALEALVATARSGGAGQAAALEALSIHPPASPIALGGVALTTPQVVALAIRIGDLRSLDPILGIVGASDPALRAAAITALGEAGDTRAVEIARMAVHDPDPRVRLASGNALVRLGASDAERTVEALIADDATALDALALGRIVQGEGVTKSAAARAVASSDPDMRAAAVATLGHQASASAVRALLVLTADPLLQGDAAYALARSPSPRALGAIEELASAGAAEGGLATSAQPLRRLVARAYFARRFLRGDRSARLDALIDALATSLDPRDRAVGMEALVALGERSVGEALVDGDARVRRAGAMGAMGRWDTRTAAQLLARAVIESDEPTRGLLALGLMDKDAGYAAPTSALAERATAGGPDAPLAAFALAVRDEGRLEERVDALLTAHDPVLRAHVARGLAPSRAPDATGRLCGAYTWEADKTVRRAIIAALSVRSASPERQRVLELAARLDPDRQTRATAATALSPRSVDGRANAAQVPEIAWIRLVAAPGATRPPDSAALLARSDGLAVPIVFDDDGYALVPGVPPGEAQLRLAPALPAYSAQGP
jgi:hypothetical protein